MAGYSKTPLVNKLGIKAGHRLSLIGAPAGFTDLLAPLPDGVVFVADEDHRGILDVALLFCKERARLETLFPTVAAGLAQAGGLWVAWPKKAAKAPTDLSETVVREFGLTQGLVDNKICAIDDVWSGLRFVIRLKDRV